MTYVIPTSGGGTTYAVNQGTAGYGANAPAGTSSSAYTTGGGNAQAVPLTSVGAQVDPSQLAAETGSNPGSVTFFGWLLAWGMVIFLLWLVTRTRTGYTLVYYLAWAALILLLLTQYRWVIGVLGPAASGALFTHQAANVAGTPLSRAGATQTATHTTHQVNDQGVG